MEERGFELGSINVSDDSTIYGLSTTNGNERNVNYVHLGMDVINAVLQIKDKHEASDLLIRLGKDVVPVEYASVLGLNLTGLSEKEKSNLTIENVCAIFFGVYQRKERYSLNGGLEVHVSSNSTSSETYELIDVSHSNGSNETGKTLSPTPEDLAALTLCHAARAPQ